MEREHKGPHLTHTRRVIMTQIIRNDLVLDSAPRSIEPGQKYVYQVVDGDDLFTHGIYQGLEDAKAAAVVLLEREPNYTSAQVNVILSSSVGDHNVRI